MKKILIGVGIAISLVAISGFGLPEIGEYFQVARKGVNEALKSNISTDVELDRLDTIRRKLDLQISKQKVNLAQAEVAFDKSKEAWKCEVKRGQEIKQNLADLRDVQKSVSVGTTVKVGCTTVTTTEIRAALGSQLRLYKTCKSVCSQKAKLMKAHEESLNALKAKFNEMKTQRDLLVNQIEVLRSRNEVQKAHAAIAGTIELDDTELSRAKELAEEIENRLNIGDKLIELNQPTKPTLTTVADDSSDLIQEVDKILNPSE